MRRFFPDLAFMAVRLRDPRVRLHKYPFISIIYHNLVLHIIMSAVNSPNLLDNERIRNLPYTNLYSFSASKLIFCHEHSEHKERPDISISHGMYPISFQCVLKRQHIRNEKIYILLRSHAFVNRRSCKSEVNTVSSFDMLETLTLNETLTPNETKQIQLSLLNCKAILISFYLDEPCVC